MSTVEVELLVSQHSIKLAWLVTTQLYIVFVVYCAGAGAINALLQFYILKGRFSNRLEGALA